MRAILKVRWLLLAAWVALAAVLFVTAPDMQQLVRDKGQIGVPDGYSSSLATQILKDASGGQEAEASDAVLVFHRSGGLTAEDKRQIEQAVKSMDSRKADLHLSRVMSHFTQKELEEQLVAKDNQTILVLVSPDKGAGEADELRAALNKELEGVQAEHYLTGNQFIDEDVVKSSEEGLKRTELITLVFILAILFLVFRSAVAPFVPLVTVGLTYLISQSVVAFLVDRWDFPLSNFTQIFLVAVLFGIGTDYCILLISRFKEELAHSGDVKDAIVRTYRTAGKTVFFAGLAVLVGFASIGMSTFILYRSAAAVAIGVGVLLLALVTVVPFFMVVLGPKLFWPSRGSLEHKQSALWGWAGRVSLKRPLLTLLIIAAVVAPALLVYDGKLSYNSLDEIGEKYDSVKGFNIVSSSFGPGQTMPAKVVIQGDRPLDNAEGLAAIEKISRELAKVDGVETVRSATRPVGEELKDLLVSEQAKQLDQGLGQGKDGLEQVRSGLAEASKQLSGSAPQLAQAAGGAGELVKGTTDLKNGVTELSRGLAQIEKGVRDGSAGAGELKTAVAQAEASARQLAAAAEQLLAGYRQLEQGLGTFDAKYREIEQGVGGLAQALGGASQSLANLAQKHPELQQDPDFLTAQGTIAQAQQGATQLSGGLQQLNAELAKVSGSLAEANAGLAQAAAGQSQLAGGLAQLVSGLGQLQQGLTQAADGQGQVLAKLPALSGGLDQLAAGQKQLQDGFSQLDGQLGQLTQGLDQSVSGLGQISDGLKSAQDYLGGLAAAPDDKMSGFYIPTEALKNSDFQQVFDTYLSKDRKVATFDIVFEGNPYSTESIDKVKDINESVHRAAKGTLLEGGQFGVNGVTGIYADLDQISEADYSRTVVLMLIGIAIILILLLRSIIMPLYLIASLILTYYTSMAVAEIIFVDLLGYSGISWAVPFFAFVILVALGIDYSIFLMDRFNEYKTLSVREAIVEAMKNMGTVIISAAVILGGTFAAMLPSGVLSLLEIATIVITGLLLYALVFLPFFIPVMVNLFGNANWWPFLRKGSSSHDNELSA
ncbi:transporter [Paenibacillus sp. J31TS4]|uniref:MMPL/RND family transporter n=1 Tax=Paenibacillus sp. J31TS4 TaxID=2807195 RepID=UPI001B07B790|nr:MMPL family transporter [Paenibacillus sp. J31TS4]GIP40389.1 transporter [Paenibacillus sp. J31TS4]